MYGVRKTNTQTPVSIGPEPTAFRTCGLSEGKLPTRGQNTKNNARTRKGPKKPMRG